MIAFLPAGAASTCITKEFSVDTLKDSKPTLQARQLKAEHSPGFVDTAFEWTRPAHEYDTERAVVSRIRSQHAAGEEVGPDCNTRAAQVVYTAMLGPLSYLNPADSQSSQCMLCQTLA